MSARQVQRLEQQRLGKPIDASRLIDEEEEEETVRPKHNAFSNLSAFGQDDDSDDMSESDETHKELTTKPNPFSSQSASSNSKKKKNKKKAKKKEAHYKDVAITNSNPGNELEDELLNAMMKEAQESSASMPTEDTKSRFSFLTSSLDPDNEVKRKLGRGLSSGAPSARAAAKAKVPRGMRLVLPAGVTMAAAATSIPRVLVTPDPDWFNPPTFASGEGAHMIRIGTNSFTFEASSSYVAAQSSYRELVKTFDPNEIIHMIQTHPFHVDALLQLVDVFASSSQNETAQLMLRRALFTLESWCSPAFRSNLGSGEAKIKFAPELESEEDEEALLSNDCGSDCGLNGAFMRAIAKAMRVAGRRDCNETAFNLAKMLISLAPDRDPCFGLLVVDFYALRCKEYDWILASHDSRELKLIPAVSFARAIALFYKTRQMDSTLPRAEADDELRLAARRFPFYARGVLSDASRPVPKWMETVSVDELSERLCALSVTRHQPLWTTELVSWLAETLKTEPSSSDPELPQATADEVQWARKYARCRLADLTDKINLLPREELAQDEMNRMGFFDQAGEDLEAHRPVAPPNVNLRLNDLLLFMQTMLPWARLPGQDDEADARDDGERGDDAD